MAESLNDRILRWLRIPAAPTAPEGERGAHVRVFRAGANFYRYNLVRWGLKQASAVIGLLVGLLILRFIPGFLGQYRWILYWIEIGAWITFVAQLPITFALLRLDFELRWYVVTDRSLRIREGLTTLREQTMTFANIQNMAIRQGPLQRLLGIADLEVHTAGGGGGSEESDKTPFHKPMHVGVFRGVDNAAEIRDTIRDRARRHLDAGLGDPDDVSLIAPAPEGSVPSMTVNGAAQNLLAEVRALRLAATF